MMRIWSSWEINTEFYLGTVSLVILLHRPSTLLLLPAAYSILAFMLISSSNYNSHKNHCSSNYHHYSKNRNHHYSKKNDHDSCTSKRSNQGYYSNNDRN